MGVLLHGQVQHCGSRVQVRATGFTVGQPGHRDLAEDGGEAAGVAGLDSTSTGPDGVEDVDPALPDDTQVDVVLEQLAQQPAAFDVESAFQLGMVEPGHLLAAEPSQDGLEAIARPGETIGARRCGLPAHRPRPERSAARPAAAARSNSALASSKRASAAATSATSASARVRVLVRPPSV